jgi:hypothetical protein
MNNSPLNVCAIVLAFRNFIRRQWRGEFPLWLSLWGGLCLVLIVIWVLNLTLGRVEELTQRWDSAYTKAAIVVFFYGVTGSLETLWLVGAWRSSNKASPQAKSVITRFLANITIMLVSLVVFSFFVRGLVPQFENSYFDILGDPQQGARGVRLIESNKEIEVYGFISRSVTSSLGKAVAEHPGITTVRFDSPGGRVDSARNMRDLIKSRHLDTFVSGQCNSSCTIAFLGGHNRLITPTARMGFHAPGDGAAISRLASRELEEEAVAEGVTPSFAKKAYTSPKLWFPTASVLKSAGVATDITNRN